MPAATNAYDRLALGARFVTPPRIISAEDARDIVRLAGYTHPMFAWAMDGASPAEGPIPGQLTLLLLGGMAEQTDLFDATTLALVGLDAVEFKTPARCGDSLHLAMEVVDKRLSASGRRGFVTFAWTCRDQSDGIVLTARATFAFRMGGT